MARSSKVSLTLLCLFCLFLAFAGFKPLWIFSAVSDVPSRRLIHISWKEQWPLIWSAWGFTEQPRIALVPDDPGRPQFLVASQLAPGTAVELEIRPVRVDPERLRGRDPRFVEILKKMDPERRAKVSCRFKIESRLVLSPPCEGYRDGEFPRLRYEITLYERNGEVRQMKGQAVAQFGE